MKLKSLQTVNSVRFNKRDETHFSTEKPTMAGLQMSFDDKIGIVTVTIPGQDSVLIFPANIAYAAILEEVKPVKKAL